MTMCFAFWKDFKKGFLEKIQHVFTTNKHVFSYRSFYHGAETTPVPYLLEYGHSSQCCKPTVCGCMYKVGRLKIYMCVCVCEQSA